VYLASICCASICAAAQSIRQQSGLDSSLLPNPKPGITSIAASMPPKAAAAAPYDAYSQGSLSYPLLEPYFEKSGNVVPKNCSGAGAHHAGGGDWA
jgi:hypothetical protein